MKKLIFIFLFSIFGFGLSFATTVGGLIEDYELIDIDHSDDFYVEKTFVTKVEPSNNGVYFFVEFLSVLTREDEDGAFTIKTNCYLKKGDVIQGYKYVELPEPDLLTLQKYVRSSVSLKVSEISNNSIVLEEIK